MEKQLKLKQNAAKAVFDEVRLKLDRESILGVGTGSTVNCFIELLKDSQIELKGVVSSSDKTTERLRDIDVEIFELNSVSYIDYYIDGADEVDKALNLIKGGGAALTTEKIVASVAKEFWCIIDESKQSPTLGRFPLPVEVIPSARSCVARQLLKLGANPVYREGVVTDHKNILIDCYDFQVANPFEMEQIINNIPGVVCNGIFSRQAAHRLFVANDQGVTIIDRHAQ
jgi:ribose 5-phosphate isomerase A